MMSVSVIICFALFHVLSCIVQTEAVVYTEIVNLEANCTGRDSCNDIVRSSDFSKRNCECDNFCSAFGDCCVDAPSANRFKNMGLTCMGFGMQSNLGVFIIDKCPRRYDGPVDIRRKCETEDDLMDPLASTPATSLPVGITYRNKYCAECNRAKLASLRSWEFVLNCDSLGPYETQVNETFVWNNIEYRTEWNGWGVEFRGEFHYCDILFDKPKHLPSSKVRLCRANMVSTCPRNWENVTVKRSCESYTAVLFDTLRRDEKDEPIMYKNVHCAMCNNAGDISGLKCDVNSIFRRPKPFSFAMLVDVNRSNGDIVGEVQRCPVEEVYDPFFKKCRAVKCVIPGYTLVDGNCVQT